MTVPQAHARGLTIPDPDLEYNESTKTWKYGTINWDEFWTVVRGNGPCNKQRLKARVDAHENGRWVREAAEAYASKHA